MRKISILCFFLCIGVIFFSCTSAEYIKTGNEFSRLADTDEIAIFTFKPEKKYDVIGLVRIKGGSPESRIAKAVRYAREKGGNGIIVREIGVITEPGTENVIQKVEKSTYDTQEFVIIKTDDAAPAAKTEKLEELKDDGVTAVPGTDPSKSDSPLDYSSIPRASYKQLLNNYESLDGKLFRGTLYPKKIYKIPNSLKSYTKNGERLVLLSTLSGKNTVYLIVDKDNLPAVRKKISSGEKLDFVYSPLNVFTTKDGTYPVIKFVEEIAEPEK